MAISSSHAEAMLPIDGLFAILIYLNKTKPPTYPKTLRIHSHEYWGLVQDIRVALDCCWQHLISVTPAQELPGLEALLSSFPTPMSFYEAAIFTFRNTLTGPKPESLDAVIALCVLSHVTLSFLHQLHGSVDFDLYFDNDVWRDAIQDLEHRQTFNRLIEILFPETSPLSPRHTAPSFPPTMVLDLPSSTPHQNEDAGGPPPILFIPENDSLMCDWSDNLWSCLDAVNEYPIEPTSHHTSSLADLQGSAIMRNITRFLEECGESMHIFSGRGLTAKDLRSCVAFNQQGFAAKNLITSSFIQPLREHDICKEPSISGILSIVDRFVDLGYLQTIGEVRDYMLFVGKVDQPMDSVVEFD
jgi:hypothetical protein